MIEKLPVDSERYYSPSFSKFASFERTKEYYPLIGELISIFNGIEQELNESLVTLINNEQDEIGWILISDMPYSSKVKTWSRLINYYINELEEKGGKDSSKINKDYKSIEKTLEELGTDRNAIAHADWEGMNENLYVKARTKHSKNGVEHFHIKLNKEEFEKLIERFDKWSLEFSNFNTSIEKLIEKELN